MLSAPPSGIEEPAPFGPIEAGPTFKVVTFAPSESVESLVEAMAAAGAGRIGRYTRCSFRSPGSGSFLGGDLSDPVVGRAGSPTLAPEIRVEMVAPASHRDAVLAALVAAHPYEEPAFDVIPTVSNLGFVGRVGIAPVRSLDRFAASRGGTAWPGRAAGRRGPRAGAAADRRHPRVGWRSDRSGGGRRRRRSSSPAMSGTIRPCHAIERGVAVLDPGHTATERPGIRALYAAIRSMEPGAIDLTHLDPTPWRDLR